MVRPRSYEDAGTRLFQAEGLVKHFPVGRRFLGKGGRVVHAVDGVDFSIERGESFGLVGESGSGKSTTANLVMGLLKPTAGRVQFDGMDMRDLNRHELRQLRSRIQIVFQNPYSSLDPRMTVAQTVAEPLHIHGLYEKMGGDAYVSSILDRVGLAQEHRDRLPHQFSGGQRQRIAIARAVILKPDLLVLDEPVSALDISIQAQVLNLLQELQKELGLAYLLISHDLAVVRQVCDRLAIMYLGNIVEVGPTTEIYAHPRHPYTKALLSAVPSIERAKGKASESIILTGELPSAITPPSGCRFRTRCWRANDTCTTTSPALEGVGTTSHNYACHHPL